MSRLSGARARSPAAPRNGTESCPTITLSPSFRGLPGDPPVVDQHTVGAVEILDDGVGRTRQDHRMVAADELRIDLQIVVRRTPDRGLATQHVDDFGVAVGADEQPRRAIRGAASEPDSGRGPAA